MYHSAPDPHPPGRSRTRRPWALVLGIGMAALVATPGTAQAQTPAEQTPAEVYVTTTSAPQRSLDVSAFSPECIRDAPFINYTIVPVGFTPVDGSATLVIRAANGTIVDTRQVTSLSGQIIWPGWKLADDGVSWIPDPSAAFLRDGLSIEVTVNPTASATVSYPPATSACANPSSDERVCEPGDADCAPRPCVPGQNNDANPADDCELPSTGGGPGNLLLVGAAGVLGGLLLFTSARRRRGLTPPAG